MKTQAEHGEVYRLGNQKDDLENFTKENLLQDKSSVTGAKKNPLNRKEKHNREVQSLVLMDSILDQISCFTAKEKIADFVKVLRKSTIGCKKYIELPNES